MAADLLSAEVRERIARLDLTAQALVEGPISGLHKSPFQGFSVEFAQHREYAWGDELKHIDWKVFARTDRYYVKQYEEETNLATTLVVDASESMAYQGERAPLSKYEVAATLAVGLAFLLVRQQDSAGLLLFDDAQRLRIPPSAHPSQLRQLAGALSEATLRGEHGAPDVLHPLAEELGRRGVVVVISDLLFPAEHFLEGIRHLRHRGHEVIVLHVLDPDELDFPFDETTRFEGLEGLPHLLTDPRALRSGYLEALRRFLDEVSEGVRRARADYVRVDTSVHPGQTLARYLNQRRQRRHRRGS
ncbi:MAG: DUF58 domain-containing protein [Planctomycetota bacterium]